MNPSVKNPVQQVVVTQLIDETINAETYLIFYINFNTIKYANKEIWLADVKKIISSYKQRGYIGRCVETYLSEEPLLDYQKLTDIISPLVFKNKIINCDIYSYEKFVSSSDKNNIILTLTDNSFFINGTKELKINFYDFEI